MFHLTTTEVAVYAATVGTGGLGLTLISRRDSTWLKKAKKADEIGNSLNQLRDAIALAQQGKGALISTRIRADLDALEEFGPKAADRKLRRRLKSVCEKVSIASSKVSIGGYAEVSALQDAAAAINSAIDRLVTIERKSPGH